MKSFYSFSFFVLTVSVLFLNGCQTEKTAHLSCKSASNPFDDNPVMSESEYNGAYFPNIEISQVCKFSGEVLKDQYFRQEITKNLVFCLKPNKLGWEISVTDTLENDCERNFNVPVTPPWHGENPIFISGYQFRNSDNTDVNDGSVNAPQEIRCFNFVFSQEGYERMLAERKCLQWNIDCSDSGMEEEQIYTSRGILTITELELGNLIPNEQAWIDSMKFDVEIYLPKE